MEGPTEAPPRNLIDGVDVDAVAQATRGCRGVEDLHGGFPGEVATYLPGRRLAGVRVGSHAVEVQVRAAWNTPVQQIADGIRAAVAPLAGGRTVDVIIGDLGDPPGSGQTGAGEPGISGQSDAEAKEVAAEPARTGDRMNVAGEQGTGVQATARHGWPITAGEEQSDPPVAQALTRPVRSDRQPEHLDQPAPPGQPESRPAKAEGK
jgi:hypothetical protein